MKALPDVFKLSVSPVASSGLCHGVATAIKTNKFLQLKSHTDLTFISFLLVSVNYNNLSFYYFGVWSDLGCKTT